MQNNYNMNQNTLSIALDYIPEKNHPARYINELVESLEVKYQYQFGRPREYNLSAMMKLVLLAYSYGIFSSRKIERFAQENKPAEWLVGGQTPSYRTICRFRISDELKVLTTEGLTHLTKFLKHEGLIGDVSFIDGTKILADANKYSFVWKKNTIRFDKLNREKLVELLGELHAANVVGEVPEGSNLTPELLDIMIGKVEDHLILLDQQVEKTKQDSPNPAKQRRRKLKSKKRILANRQVKLREHQTHFKIYGNRNSYSKTDHDATFMRIKEDPMKNGQLKPAYNLQIASNNQFITGYQLFQNPTDTRTLPEFVNQLQINKTLGTIIVADAGYGSESNYRYLEDQFQDHTVLIPYGTMLKENSRKWKSDDRKIMNWDYHDKNDYFVNPQGVHFNFHTYRIKTDKYGFERNFKEYIAEKFDKNHQVISDSLTPSGYLKRILINEDWEYFKAKERSLLSNSKTSHIYAQRKIDVEPIFGRMKAYLRFNRFSVRGLDKVSKETGIVMIALNILKLASLEANLSLHTKIRYKGKSIISFIPYFLETYVTASFICFFAYL